VVRERSDTVLAEPEALSFAQRGLERPTLGLDRMQAKGEDRQGRLQAARVRIEETQWPKSLAPRRQAAQWAWHYASQGSRPNIPLEPSRPPVTSARPQIPTESDARVVTGAAAQEEGDRRGG
jgi:hypothetical protein